MYLLTFQRRLQFRTSQNEIEDSQFAMEGVVYLKLPQLSLATWLIVIVNSPQTKFAFANFFSWKKKKTLYYHDLVISSLSLSLSLSLMDNDMC